jgi:hypothetical protein
MVLGNNSARFFSDNFLLSFKPEILANSSFVITIPQTYKSPDKTPAALFSFYYLFIDPFKIFSTICYRIARI